MDILRRTRSKEAREGSCLAILRMNRTRQRRVDCGLPGVSLPTPRDFVRREITGKHHGRDPSARSAADLTAPADLQADADDDDVDRASHHRRRALLWHAA